MGQNITSLIFGLAAFAGLFVIAEPYLSGEKTASKSAPDVNAATIAPAIIAAEPAQNNLSSSAVALRKSDDGQFWAEGHANSGHIKFLVDTGASVVALTAEDARKAGYDLSRLSFDRRVKTANGETMGAYVRIDRLTIGTLTLTNVDALVLQDGLSVSLLGMSYLGRLQKLEVSQNSMILRL